jgi:hypothetical protein
MAKAPTYAAPSISGSRPPRRHRALPWGIDRGIVPDRAKYTLYFNMIARMERSEIREVIRWWDGPGFRFAPSGLRKQVAYAAFLLAVLR